MITERPTIKPTIVRLPLSVSSVKTAPAGDGVCRAVIRVEQQEDVRVDGGVGHDGHPDDGFHDSAPRLMTPNDVLNVRCQLMSTSQDTNHDLSILMNSSTM